MVLAANAKFMHQILDGFKVNNTTW